MKLDVRFIAPASSGPAVLQAADGALPAAEIEGDDSESAVIAITAHLRDAWGWTAPVLETHPKWKGIADGAPIPCLAMTEPAEPGWMPPPELAFSSAAADTSGLPASIRPRADELLAELRDGTPPPELRPRWSRRGWFARASAWMQAAAADAGQPLTAEPRPFFLRGISALLRAPTAGPDLFLKDVFRPFHAEPVLTRLLAERFPGHVPPVVAIEPDEGWLLTEDIGSAWVGDVAEAARAAALARGAAALVAIQRAVAADETSQRILLDAGAPHRPISDLVASLARSIGPQGMGVGDPLEPDRAARVLASVEAAVTAIEQIGLPESVVHGDFHSGNAAVVDDRIVIIDWSDAAISNPAVDVITWIGWSGDRQNEIDAAIEAWIDAWSTTVDADALRLVIDDVLIVGAAYQIVSYDGIRRNLEPATQYTMTGGGEHFLKDLEKVLDRREGAARDG